MPGSGHAALGSDEKCSIALFFLMFAPPACAEEARITGGEFAVTALALAAGSMILIALLWLWSQSRRRGLKREIERNEALFNAFFLASPAGMAILDHELHFVRINPPLASLFGLAEAALSGLALEQVAPELAAHIAPMMREALVSGSTRHKIEVSIPGASGNLAEERHWLISLFPIPSPQGRNPLGVGTVILDIGDRKRAELALERSRAELRRLAAHREDLIEREHQRLAREFHDELGQLLTTARMHLQLLARQIDIAPDQAGASIRGIDAMIVDAYRSIKNIASDLRPAALNLGLTAAIEWLVDRMLNPIGIACAVECDPAVDRLDDACAIALFRIVQESLTNIIRHAAAKNVHIGISLVVDVLDLVIADDGRGFEAERVDRAKQFGLLGITERVASLGGRLELVSHSGAGTKISVRLTNPPLKASTYSPERP